VTVLVHDLDSNMSVAINPCYRDDAFQVFARFLGVGNETIDILEQTLDYKIEECGDYMLPGDIKPGNVKKQLHGSLEKFQAFYCGPKAPVNKSFLMTFSKNDRITFGLPAVYKVFNHLRKLAPNMSFSRNLAHVEKLTHIGAVIAQHTPKDSLNRSRLLSDSFQEHALPYYEAFKRYLKIATHYRNREYNMEVKYQKSIEKEMPSVDTYETKTLLFSKCYVFPGLVVVQIGLDKYILHRKDTERLERLLKGYGLAKFHIHNYSIMSEFDRQKVVATFNSIMDHLFQRIPKLNMESAQLLCRSFDVAYFTYLAHVSSDVDTLSLAEQQEKARKEGLNQIIDIPYIVDLVKDFPIRDAIELLQFYKIMPQPDFDEYSATYRQQELYKKKNTISDEDLFLAIKRHHKLLMIKAYYSRHKVCPGIVRDEENLPKWANNYPNINPSIIQSHEVDEIDIAGHFIYMDHMLDCFDLIKDKAICPLEINDVKTIRDINMLPVNKKNYLLDMISRPEPVSTAVFRDKFKDLFIDVKVEDKAEAKKPNGRWFMEAHSDVRLVLSEYELSVANYGKHLEGFMQGKGLIEKQKMMNHISEATEADMGVTELFISFDINKWSPRMPIEVHKFLDEQWSEAFGMPFIKDVSRIFTDGDLHYVKNKIHHVLKKTGSDFEGFAGRKLTMFHLAVMHAATDILKAEKLIQGNTRYACQIDDGVLRVTVKTHDIQNTVKKIRKRLGEIWLAAGIEISWDKTFISRNFVTFLNEIRYQGRSIGNGMRAFVKLTNNAEVPVPSILNDIAVAESTIRGAIVAGQTPMVAYFTYIFLVYDVVNKWKAKTFQILDRHHPMFFAPVGLGGLGVSNLMSLMGALEHDAFQVGLSNLKMIWHRFPNTKASVKDILQQKIQSNSEERSVVNPNSIIRVGKTFRSDRLMVAMRNALAFWLDKPNMRAYGFSHGVAISEMLQHYVAIDYQLPSEMRELWFDSSIKASVDNIVNKVISARTVFGLVPRRLPYRLMLANVNEAKTVFNTW
jgi:hypothetical protein